MLRHLRLLAWLISGAAIMVLLTLPVSTAAQLALSAGAIVAMLTAWTIGRGRFAHWTFLTLGGVVVCRYIFWRATSTLPPLDQPVNFVLGVTLLMAELYCVLILAVSLIINADPLDRPDLDTRDFDGEGAAALPSVDIFIPTYNEDEYILATTISAAKLLDYPAEKLTVWLLDDGGTDQKCADADPIKAAAAQARRASLRTLCDELGACYVTRAKNDHAKAGNLNNGLKHATGTIVGVFDADHAPFRNFLRETVGHFAQDPKLFLVQTPHVFLNPDPIERNLRTFQRMPSENEMFYSITQRGLDKWNGSFFCGSAALLRREALDVVGGFSGITITEDCETAFDLHSKGWTSVYVDKPMIAGLQPETLESFIGQRSRWCQGMFQLLLLKNPLMTKGLKPIQRVAYLSSMVFWLFPLPRMVFTVAPLLHIFFNVKIFVSSMDEAVAYTATYMIVNLMLQNYLYGRFRWPFMSELYEYIQSVYLFRALVAVALKPRSPTFNVTAKGVSLDQDHLSSLAWPFFAIFGVLAVGAVTAFTRYFFEPGAELMLIVGLWTTFNLVIAGVALGVVAERREPDRFPRLAIQRSGALSVGVQTVGVTVSSVSAGGCSVTGDHAGLQALPLGARAAIQVTPLNQRAALTPLVLDLIHKTTLDGATTYGFAFADMTAASYVALADLMYGDPGAMPRFLQKRRTHRNLVRGMLRFIFWGASEPLRAFSYALRRNPTVAVPAVTVETIKTVVELSLNAAVAAPVARSEVVTPASNVVTLPVAPPAMLPAIDASTDFDALASLFVETAPAPRVEIAAPADTRSVSVLDPADWLRVLMGVAERELAPGADATPVDVAASVAA